MATNAGDHGNVPLLPKGIPVAHGTTFEALREVSPMLASHAGLDTAHSSLADVAAKVAAAAAALAEDDG